MSYKNMNRITTFFSENRILVWVEGEEEEEVLNYVQGLG
jgi:hypothetical protein